MVVSLDNPLQPKITAEIGEPFLKDARGVAVPIPLRIRGRS